MIQRTNRRLALCITLLCLNLAFIWGNSLLPGEVSGAFSQWVKDLLTQILHLPATDEEQGHGLLRKLAHFTEFACLGAVLSCFVRMLRTKLSEHLALPLLGGFLAAFTDETIQCFVPDRGPGILDVGIDTLGVSLGIGIVCLVLHTKEKKSLKRNQTDEKTDRSAVDAGNGADRCGRLQK